MDTLTIESTQIDMMIQEVWKNLSDSEKEKFLKEIQTLDQECNLEIQENIVQTHIS